MHTLVFFNHAGGVGKTSSVRDVGFMLAASGFKVLLIDADPQANLTEWLGVTDEITNDETIYSAVMPSDSKSPTYVLPPPRQVHNLDLIPANLDLAKLDVLLVTEFNSPTRLRKAVAQAKQYDFVLIDPPPSLGQLSAISVIAADQVVVPLPTNSKGLRGVATVQAMIDRYVEVSPNLRLSFFLLTQFDSRTRHDQEAVQAVRLQLSPIAPVSTPLNSRPAIYKDAQITGLPIPLYRPNDPATGEIKQVTRELLAALGINEAVNRGH